MSGQDGETNQSQSSDSQPEMSQNIPQTPAQEHSQAAPPGGRYHVLLDQVHLVNNELQAAKKLIASFKKENEELVSNFDICKNQLLETRQKYNSTKEELLEATERQMRTDQKNEAFREEAMAQLAEREEVLRDLQSKLVPQDVDLLRIQIEEELEKPMRARVSEAEAEAKKFETLFYNVRRTFEREKTEHALFKEQVRAAIESDRAVFEAELSELHSTVERMRSEAMRTNLDETLNSVEDSLQKSLMRETMLKEEVKSLHRKLEEADALRLGDASAAVDALSAAQADLSHAKTDLVMQKRLLADSEAKCQSFASEVNALREALSEKAVEIDKVKSEMAQREREVNETEKRVVRDHDRRKAVLDAESKKNEERRRVAEENLMKEQEACSVEKRNCRERCDRALASEDSARKECKKMIDTLQTELKQFQESESNLRLEFKEVVFKMESDARKLRDEVHANEVELAKANREVLNLQQKVERMAEAISSERKEKENMLKKEQGLNNDAVTMKQKISELEAKLTETTAAERAQASALTHLQKEYSVLVAAFDEQRRNHMDSIKKLEEDFEEEREESLKEARRQHELLRTAAANALEKENRRTEKYKEAARTAHEFNKKAKSQLKQSKPHHSSGLKSRSRNTDHTSDSKTNHGAAGSLPSNTTRGTTATHHDDTRGGSAGTSD